MAGGCFPPRRSMTSGTSSIKESSGQTRVQNNTISRSAIRYRRFPIPMALVHVHDVPRDAIRRSNLHRRLSNRRDR